MSIPRVTSSMLAVLLLCMAACRKDPEFVVTEEGICVPTPQSPLTGWNYIPEMNTLDDARFNPDNPQECMFSTGPIGSPRKVWIYNLQTRQLRLVFSSYLIFPCEWGPPGWISLNAGDENVYKIKTNGDSLTQLTFTGGCYAPIWDRPRERIGFYTSIGSSFIIDSHGTYLDTLEAPCSMYDGAQWYDPFWITSATAVDLRRANIVDCQVDVLAHYSPNNSGGGTGVTRISEHAVVWSTDAGVWSTDINTHQTTKLLTTCNASYYVGLSYHPAINKLLTIRIDRVPAGNNLMIYTKLVMMDPDGTNSEELEIPFPG